MKVAIQDLKDVMNELNLSCSDFASLIGIDVRSITRWLDETSTPTLYAKKFIFALKWKLEKDQKDPIAQRIFQELVNAAVQTGGLSMFLTIMFDNYTQSQRTRRE